VDTSGVRELGLTGEGGGEIKALFSLTSNGNLGTAMAQWLRYCVTNRKVAGSIPYGVIRIFH
jgi:hypothetical protein